MIFVQYFGINIGEKNVETDRRSTKRAAAALCAIVPTMYMLLLDVIVIVIVHMRTT